MKGRGPARSLITRLSPDDSAYLEGTNDVTKLMVDLWREKLKQKGDKDLEQQRVVDALEGKTKEELQEPDGKGYTALTKACSLPRVSSRMPFHLMNTKMVDVNSQLPSELRTNDAAARHLIPKMSALSVAIRRGNVKCVSTFMNKKKTIAFASKDRDGNTALHHCVLSPDVLKDAFRKLFPYYQSLEWQDMRNEQGKNPLDIGVEQWKRSVANKDEKKKEVLEYVLGMMDPDGQWKNQ